MNRYPIRARRARLIARASAHESIAMGPTERALFGMIRAGRQPIRPADPIAAARQDAALRYLGRRCLIATDGRRWHASWKGRELRI